ncbi:rep protein [Naiadivirus wakense]|uniref:Rep protein n=1 Tax=Circoviridae sp. TaxID=1954248 RepID=A0ABY4CH47_9VIRU|nr:rep protein [Circoviridae sp.]
MTSKSRRFCFTINNPTNDESTKVATFLDGDRVVYGVVGREVGETGTPHLQGFVILTSPQRFAFLHTNLCARAHLEVARAKSSKAAEYCKKDGDFDEYGELPDSQGKRSDIELFKEWVLAQSVRPSERMVASAFPALYLRYRTNLLSLVGHLSPQPAFGLGGELREWQRELVDCLDDPPDDRSIDFYIDPDGNSGKTWIVRYLLQEKPEEVQVLSVGKRDDLAHAVDETKSIFLFDIPRGGMEFLQYTVLEKLKDQIIFSGKYESGVKVLPSPVHVIVFCNEEPDLLKLTHDRYKLTNLAQRPERPHRAD